MKRRAVTDPADSFALWKVAELSWNPDRRSAARLALKAFVSRPSHLEITADAMLALRVLGRLGDVSRLLPRTPRRLPPVENHPVSLEPLISLYARLLQQQDQRRDEGWTPSQIEETKFATPLSLEHLANFRSSEASSGTQTVPERPPAFASMDFSRLYPPVSREEQVEWEPELHNTRNGMLLRLIRGAATWPENTALRDAIDFADDLMLDDGRFGTRLFQLSTLGPVTAKSLQSTYYACRIFGLVPRGGSVLEIGGGFGAVASRVLRIRPDVTYVLTDLPVNLVMTYAFLRSHFGDAVYGAFEGPIHPPKGTRAIVVPPWRLPELAGRASLAFNSMSFQHMDERNHLYYGAAMKQLRVRRLYHLNRQDIRPGDTTVKIRASDYSFLDQFDIRQEQTFDSRWVEVIADRK